jgi:hypothetical protein
MATDRLKCLRGRLHAAAKPVLVKLPVQVQLLRRHPRKLNVPTPSSAVLLAVPLHLLQSMLRTTRTTQTISLLVKQ